MRQHISLLTKLAATLLQLRGPDGEPLIPYEHAKLMSAEQICSLYEFDHYPIRKADGGPDEPWNLQPLGIIAHRIKTAGRDKPELAKQARLRGETCNGPKRKIHNRGFDKTKSRTFTGKVVAREARA